MSPARFILDVPLFAGLDADELAAFASQFQPVSFEPGACLVRQGQPADSAYILESGTAEVVTALPGGGEAAVATLGPGSVLGEMALIEGAARVATVIARSPVSSYALERETFRMLLAQRNRAAFEIQRRIARALCARLRELNARVLSAGAPGGEAPAFSREAVTGTGAPAPAFDYRAFLPSLPLFHRMSGPDLDEFARLGRRLDFSRGEPLFEQGSPSGEWYVVVRGAVEIDHARGEHRHRLGILGPGRLCGLVALMEEAPHSMSAVARETTALLVFDRTGFERLYAGGDRLAGRFQDAVNQELLQALARTNNQLTRLVSQARIRGAREREAELSALERALRTQDCRVS
ncbi:MAG: cyclic nucleotide-binding domain-containing protein [Burkholderiales bacterium]|nr:cyclic nucleotide-binding domain-containing protein [Burkholderiales bacterium]